MYNNTMDFFITETKSQIRKVKPGDKHFKIQDNLTMCDRAAIEISQSCPSSISSIILDAYNRGWIKPIAHITEREMIFAGLTE